MRIGDAAPICLQAPAKCPPLPKALWRTGDGAGEAREWAEGGLTGVNVGGDNAADRLRYLIATKSRGIAQRELEGAVMALAKVS